MSLLDVALNCIARGWYVFPCKPRAKEPLIKGGFHAATSDAGQVDEWWTKWPEANVGIATGASGLTVLDIDTGINNGDDLAAYRASRAIPETFAVRTGRRPGFGAQLYFTGGDLKSVPWTDDEAMDPSERVTGDIRSGTGYVLAAGSIHPSGAAYETLIEAPIASTPAFVRALKSAVSERSLAGDEPIREHRNSALTSIAGKLRNAGLSADALEVSLLAVNLERCDPPMDESEVKRIAANASKWALPTPDAAVTIGKPTESVDPADWRGLFHTREETENAPDPEFLIDGFLQVESITGLIGPARARKSIVTLNVIHSLLTGESLFGRHIVSNRAERVVYLCPESGRGSLARRIRNMGLARFVGDTLFYTSMNSDPITLIDPRLREAVNGSVLFIDTAIRFFSGNENEASDMKKYGDELQSLIRGGVRAIVLLHHTAKNVETITLESGRGSGDFGGFLTCCWGTTLDDYEDAYNTPSLLTCVKQRDFQAASYKVAPSGDGDNFFLKFIDGSENAKVQVGAKEKAGKAQALAFIQGHTEWTGEAIHKALAGLGIDYSVSACRVMLREARASVAMTRTDG